MVHIVGVALGHVDAVHVHQNVPDHDHARLVVLPRRVQSGQEVVVQRVQHIRTNLQQLDYLI